MSNISSIHNDTNPNPPQYRYEDPLINQVLESRYRIDEEVGRGGMGVVYKGTDLTLQRPVAIKTIIHRQANEEGLNRFIKEARTLAQIENPRLVPVYAVGQDDGYHYIVMKFLEGETLAEKIKRDDTLSVSTVREIIRQVCEALNALHRKGLIHRDIKPANLMVAPDGQVTVMDLGIVKEVGEETSTQALAVGTPRYMAPEAIANRSIDARADLYSLGVIAYLALSGQHPFDGPTPMSVLFKQAHEQAIPIKDLVHQLPKNLAIAIEIALEKEPEFRFQSATEMADAFSHDAYFPDESSWLSRVTLYAIPLLIGIGVFWFLDFNAFIELESTSVRPEVQKLDTDEYQEDFIFEEDHLPASQDRPKARSKKSNKTQRTVKEPRFFSINLESIPSNAQVYRNGKYLGKTPLKVTKKKGRKEKLTVKLRGYKTRKVWVGDKNERIKLQSEFQL